MSIHFARLSRFAVLCIVGVACTETIAVDPRPLQRLEVAAGATVETLVVHSFVPVAPAVRVVDDAGVPVVGARVRFSVTGGRGTAGAATVTTGPDGIASAGSWRFGTVPGPQELTAALASATTGARVVFSGTAIIGATARLSTTPASSFLHPGQTRRFVVDAFDEVGNPTGTAVDAAFASADPAVASVSADGLVTGVALGRTIVTATWEGVTDSVPVSVGLRPAGDIALTVLISDRPYGVAVSPQGTVYVGRVTASQLTRLELPGVSIAGTVPLNGPAYDIAFLPSGDRAYAVDTPARGVNVIDRATHTQVQNITHLGEVFRVEADPSGAYVYASTSSGFVHRISTADHTVQTLSVGGDLNGLTVNAARGVLYASSTGGTFHEFDLASFSLTRSIHIGGTLQGVAVPPDGSRIAVASETEGVHILDAASLTTTRTLMTLTGAFDVAFTLDGVELYVAQANGNGIGILDATTFETVRSYPGGTARRVAMSRDGLSAIVTNEGGWITIIR